MSYADIGLEPTLLEHAETASERRDAELARHLHRAREASRTPSLRQRAGEAVIAFGVRLAGDRRTMPEVRRVAARAG